MRVIQDLLPLAVLVPVVMALACCNGPVVPTSTCGGGGSLFGPSVSGFAVDVSGLTNAELRLRVGERSRLRVTVGRPSVSADCDGSRYPAFIYMHWSWNSIQSAEPQIGPIDVTMASCKCTLFGEPYWTGIQPTGHTPHWEQRAWLGGEQTLELEVRAVAPGTTSLVVTGFVGPPCGNPGYDCAFFELNFLSARVTP